MNRITVLAVGNTIMGDDGVGPELLAALRAARPDPAIDYVDGGIGGLELLEVVEDAPWLLVLDAVAGAEPGAVVDLAGDQVPRLLSAKLSPHQVGLLDVLTAARLLGREPGEVAVVGIVPESVELRVGLSDTVAGAVEAAVERAAGILDRWLGKVGDAVGAQGGAGESHTMVSSRQGG